MPRKRDDSLYNAVYANDVVGVKEALSRGSIPGANEFLTAVHNRDPEILRLLVEVPGIDLNKPGYRGMQPLGEAVFCKNLGAVKIMLAAGASPHVPSGYGSILRQAASQGFTAAIPLLLKAGADVHTREPQSNHTALMAAAWGGDLEIVKILLTAGANPGDFDAMGRNAYDLAVTDGHHEVAKLLEPFESQRNPRGKS